MAAVLALVPADMPFPVLAVLGGLLCTAVEYLIHLFYDKAFRVQFWDYGQLRGNLLGRVCPQFALVWGILSATALRWVQPLPAHLVDRIPAAVTYGVWLALAADCVLTGALLRQYRDTEMLTLPGRPGSGPGLQPVQHIPVDVLFRGLVEDLMRRPW